jgi:UDP-N-acetylmuramate--alanine ligase
VQQKGYPLMKRAEVLGMLTQNIPTIAIAGTHGKTTITSMVAHILHEAGIKITAFIGGIANNFGSNLVLSHESEFMVVEADEYDKSFLLLHPDIAVISSMDADHLDIYQDHTKMLQHYNQFASRIKKDGILIHKAGLPIDNDLNSITYNSDKPAHFYAQNIRVEKGSFVYEWLVPNHKPITVSMKVPGRHNIENALAASAVAMQIGLSPEIIAEALGNYKGVWRRFDIKIETASHVYIDDYAHHPEELKACINAVKELYPNEKITGIFQPHLFTRTRDFLLEFAQSLNLLDELILLEIYPARELPIEGITSKTLLDICESPKKNLIAKQDILEFISKKRPKILLTVGAGDIDQIVEPLQKMISTW